MWEDEHCKDGGRWSLRVPKTHSNKYWEDLILALIGEQFTNDNEILGLVISLRPHQDTISVWHKHGRDQAKIDQIKKDIETILKIDETLGMKLDYENFEDALKQKQERKENFEKNHGEKKGGDEDKNAGWGDRSAQRGGRGGRGRGGFRNQQ